MDYKKSWITLNRECNLRCKWCYAKNTEYKHSDNMPIQMAKDIVDISNDLQLRHITLIGGEPTLYPHLFELINYANEKHMRTGFISNGIKYADLNFVKTLYDLGYNNFSISLKGNDKHGFINTTEVNAFDTVITGIKNCLSLGASVVIFMVLTEYNIDNFVDCVYQLVQLGVHKFRFSFMYNFNLEGKKSNYLDRHNPHTIIKKFKEQYGRLNEITSKNFSVFPTFPACVWGKEFIKTLYINKQLAAGCQIKDKTDLIFDCHGNIIPCNAMYDIKMGQLYKDFSTSDELIEYSRSDKVTKVYKHFDIIPSEKCKTCECQPICVCCACQWTNYSFSQLMELNN